MPSAPSVLVVDDDAAVRSILGLTLRRAGFRVHTAGGGREALRRLKRSPCRWLVTDAHMSPMDGFALALKARKARPRLRIVMVSAIACAPGIAGSPIERFFAKPFASDELVGYLRNGAGRRTA